MSYVAYWRKDRTVLLGGVAYLLGGQLEAEGGGAKPQPARRVRVLRQPGDGRQRQGLRLGGVVCGRVEKAGSVTPGHSLTSRTTRRPHHNVRASSRAYLHSYPTNKGVSAI